MDIIHLTSGRSGLNCHNATEMEIRFLAQTKANLSTTGCTFEENGAPLGGAVYIEVCCFFA